MSSSRVGSWVSLAAVLALLASLVGCGGGDDDSNDNGSGGGGDKAGKQEKPVAGTFVGRASDTEALVAVVAAPPVEDQDERAATVFVCDGRRVCVWFAGSATGNDFTATSTDGEAEGELSSKAATGSAVLPDGETVRYEVAEANAAAGLYDLTVSGAGKLSGASAAGVALKGQSDLTPPGTGQIKLADGTRLKFEVTENTEADAVQLRAGQVRLIVLSDGQLSGAAKSAGDGSSDLLIRSTPE